MGDTDRIEELFKRINESKGNKAVFSLPLGNDEAYYGLLSLAESFAGFKRVDSDPNRLVFELYLKSALRYLKVCIRGVQLVPEHPIRQIELEGIIQSEEVEGTYSITRNDDKLYK